MAADEVGSETWEAVDAGSTPFTAIHTQRQQPTPKSRRIIQESHALVDLLGRKQEIRERLECDSTLSYEPVSLRHTSTGPSGTAVTEGVVQDRALVITLKRGELTLERRIPMDGLTTVSAFLPEVLAAQDPSVKELRLSVIDPESWTAEKLIASRLADADGLRHWKLTYERGWGDGVWSLTPAGVLEKAETTAPRRNIRRATADCDDKLRYFTIPDRELLVFPVSQDIPFPERLRSLKVRLTWRGIAPEQLQLEDSRQRLLRADRKDDQNVVELLLEQPKEIASSPSLPVKDPALAKCLAETPLIQAQHPLIRDQARKWIDGANTTHDAARRLAQEVSQYLRGGDLIAETLSGAEVLACRTGKCSEFTTLMASLARSSGLPTRVALGMRMTGGRWIGHMWCEVWVGQWIPVDAAANEVGGSPALLKLCHSDTVLGSQAARWAVAESLNIEILAVEKGESRQVALKTGIVGQTYSNADFACQISAPTADWKIADKSAPGIVEIRFDAPADEDGKKTATLEFFAFGMPFKSDPDALIQAVKTGLAIKFSSLEILSDAETTVLTRPGRKLVFRRDDPKVKGSKFKTTQVLWAHDRSVFMLKLSGEESLHDAGEKNFQALLAGFQEVAGDAAKLPAQKPEKIERPRIGIPEPSKRSEPGPAQPQDAGPSGAQTGPGKPRILVGHSDWVMAIAFSPDGQRLASASRDKTVKVWSLAQDQKELTFQAKDLGHIGYVQDLAFSPDGQSIATACESDKSVSISTVKRGEIRCCLFASAAMIGVDYSPNGKRVATISRDRRVRVFDSNPEMHTGKEILSLESDEPLCVGFSSDGLKVVSANRRRQVKVWDSVTGEELLQINCSNPAASIQFSPDGKRLAGAVGSEAVLWDASTGMKTMTLKGHSSFITAVAFSPDGRQLATASWDKTVKLWDVDAGIESLTLKGHANLVTDIAFSPDSTMLASGSADRTIRLWSVSH